MDAPKPKVFFEEPDDVPREPLSGRPLVPPLPKVKSTRGRKSTKNFPAEIAQVAVPDDAQLFQKQYYGISEVAAMFGVNASMIRYWANEFKEIEPRTNRKGDRFFKPEDVKTLQVIHDLVRRRKFTLEGAKAYLKDQQKAQEKYALIQSLQKLRAFLQELRAHL